MSLAEVKLLRGLKFLPKPMGVSGVVTTSIPMWRLPPKEKGQDLEVFREQHRLPRP